MNTSHGLIGVIVPVYKVEKYIAECIESILAQTYTNFRLILVDDGTPDNAGKICDEYAKKDPRITVIHQENAGVTRARARGVEEADDCEFIMFVDGDDTINIDCIKILLEVMIDTVDIVVGLCDINDIHENTIELENEEYISRQILLTTGMPQAIWGKLFRRNIFNDFVFDIPREITIGEDAIANVRLAFNSARPIIFINKSIYNYRILPNSAFHSFKNNLVYQYIFFKYLKESIPEDKTTSLYPHVIDREIFEWAPFYEYSARNIEKQDVPFIKMLKSDIQEYNYKPNFFVWIQLFCPIRTIRFLSVNLHKVKNLIRDKI